MTVGSRCASANSKIRENSVPVSMGSLWISSASLDDASMLENAAFRSSGLAASQLKKEKKAGLSVHGRTGEKCPVCGDVIREVSFADSALQYCATCQTGGKPLADRRLSRLLK